MSYEGFDQTSDYRVLTDFSIYDDFYLSIYDDLFPFEREKQVVDSVLLNTQAVPETSSILVIGGIPEQSLLSYLDEKGYKNVKCIEKSKVGVDAMNPMEFENGEFSHIFCLGETIYEHQEKSKIIENCKEWIKHGGYFIISLIQPKIYSFIPSVALDNRIEKTEEIPTKIHIDFHDFEYRCLVDSKWDTEVIRKETFIDKKTNKVRENIQSLLLDSRENIMDTIKKCGFLEKGAFDHKNGMQTIIFTR